MENSCKQNFYRQGEIIIKPLDLMSGDPFVNAMTDENSYYRGKLRQIKSGIIREGKVSGHFHTIDTTDGELYELNGKLYLKSGGHGTKLTHDEHATINIKPNLYEIYIQREYDETGDRRVID